MIVASFLVCLAVFTGVGMLSMRAARSTTEDYLVASRDVPAWLTALSSVATNNSGFMFIGLLGFTYRFGVQAVWLQAGWVVGDIVAWVWIHRRVREVSGEVGASSVPTLLATYPGGGASRLVAVVAGLLTFVFLGGYAAAQLNAGGTALHVLFGWDLSAGAVIGAGVVVAYCFAGGLRASIWTDAAQASVMLIAMAVLLGYAAVEVGGPVALADALRAADPALVQWVPELQLGLGLYLLGFVAGGLGAIGQPHILIRSMAIRSAADIPRARRVYFAWYVPFSIAAVAAGLYARVLLPDLIAGVPAAETAHAAEQALPRLAVALLPDVMIGVLLAGIFAATMSTADSQILSCSAAITQDVVPQWRRDSYLTGKLATLSVTALALTIALYADDNVFALVLGAWSALGSTLGPLLVLRVFRRHVPAGLAVAMMAVGLTTVTLWDRSGYAGAVFKLLPGMLAPLALYAAYAAVRPLVTRP